MTEYSFEPYLKAIDTNWYADDELLTLLLTKYASGTFAGSAGELENWGDEVSGRLREFAVASAQPENAPRLNPYDAYNNRVDEIVLPESTREAHRIVSGRERLGAVHGDPFKFYAKIYLYVQNGEAGVGCSLACTDGLVRVLEALGDRSEHHKAVEQIRASNYENFNHGAQFVTEIQGGSDVPANTVRAVPDGDAYRLFGQKWFCSNINADYFIVTGRPDGAPEGISGVGLFLVPAFQDATRKIRNGYRIERLKDKLGTRELATAEVMFDGALAYPIGELDRGVANLLQHVLVPSRFHCVLNATAYLRQAERIVTAYANFRTVFGKSVIEYPDARATVDEIKLARKRGLAMMFELLDLWERARTGTASEEDGFVFRVMMSLAKTVITRRSAQLIHEAMMLLGGNGIEERFSPLPRLYRDCVILETWEGPHNMLLSQALRDIERFEIDVAKFIERVGGPDREDLIETLGRVLDPASDLDSRVPFAQLSEYLVDAMADRVLQEVQQNSAG